MSPTASASSPTLAAGIPQTAQTRAVTTTRTASATRYRNANETGWPSVLCPPIVSPGGASSEPERIWRVARPGARRLTIDARPQIRI
jgi:hypothetical protein